MNLIVKYIRPYLKRMGVGVFVKFAGSVMDLLLPWILAYVIDNVVPVKDLRAVVLWGGLMLVCSILAIVGNITANRMAASVARDVTRTLRYDLFHKITSLSNRQVDEITIPTLISRMTSDTYNFHNLVSRMQRVGIRAPILVLGGILVTMTLDPVLSGVLCCMLPLMGAVVWFVSKKSVPLFRDFQRKQDKMLRVVRENASGVRVIKALSRQASEQRRFTQVNTEVMRQANRANMIMSSTSPIMNFLLNLGLVLVVLVGASRVNSGLTDVGKIVAFLSYFTIILNAMLSITRIITTYSVALASAGRIQEVMDLPREPELKDLPSQDDGEYHVVFDHVSFSYNGRGDDLCDLSLKLRRGESLGIIGPTGAGKSTVIQLLMRFYDVGSGSIRIGGQDIRTMEPRELREQFGVVFQNDVLFQNTIGENIRLGRDASPEDLRRAAAYAQAADFVEAAGGLNAHVAAKGANLSGGQKQRLLIARALAANPEILILDDSFSALDYRTDAALRGELAAHFAHTTTFVVAQRVNSIVHCDHILFLEDGKLKGYGTHEELLDSCPDYRELCCIQMGVEVAV